MDLIFSGFGGQGVLTAGMLAATAGAALNKQVLCYPSYGSEMRGGTANCSVIIDDDEIGSPALENCDILVAMNEPSLDKFCGAVRPGGHIIVNTALTPPDYPFPASAQVTRVDADGIAAAEGNARGVNLVMLGALLAATGLFERDFFARQVDDYFAHKGKTNPRNRPCIEAGFRAAEEANA